MRVTEIKTRRNKKCNIRGEGGTYANGREKKKYHAREIMLRDKMPRGGENR